MGLKSLDKLKEIRETDIFIDFENNCQTINDILKNDLDAIQEDLEVLEIMKDYLFYCPSFYRDQTNFNYEYISMSYIDKRWSPIEDYNKVKKWCYKNKIRGFEDDDRT